MAKFEPLEVTCFCPECNEEQFVVTVENSGKSVDTEFGITYWFEGHGKCESCGFESDYSDSSA